MRGIEKPQTSASTTATRLPRWASATARLVVTDDLPTPPLPEAMSSTRVRGDGSAKGIVPALGVAVALVGAGGGGRVAVELLAQRRPAPRRSSTVKSRPTSSTPSRPVTASVTRLLISFRSGQPATVSATRTPTVGPSIDDVADHVEVDDAAVQLGVLDGPEGLEDVGFGDRHDLKSTVAGPHGPNRDPGGLPRGGAGRSPTLSP